MRERAAFITIFASILVACAPQKPADSATALAAASRAPGSVSQSPSQGPTGVASPSPSPSPELAAAVAKAKECELGEDGFESSCEGYSEWGDDQPYFEDGQANAYLLSMLAGDDKSRFLAGEKLRVTLTDEEPAATVNVVLDAAEKERNTAIAKVLADTVANLPLSKTGTLERAIKIAKGHAVHEYTEQFVSGVPGDPALLPLALDASKSESEDLRHASISLLAGITKSGAAPGPACDALDALSRDASSYVKDRATSELAETHQCAALYDKLLARIAAEDIGAKGSSMSQHVGIALDAVCKDKGATPAQRAKAETISRKLSQSEKVSTNVRYYTLSAVVACDPKGGPAFVAGFKSNKSKTLADRAKALTAPAKKK